MSTPTVFPPRIGSRSGRRFLGAGVSLVLAGALATTSLPARADTPVSPSAGYFTLTGAGYGHGHGMSQYGAYGAARSGLTWRQILGFYYPGTTLTTLPTGNAIKVWISADQDNDLRVLPSAGLRVRDTSGHSLTLPTGSGYRAWRATRSGGVPRLSVKNSAGTWTTWPTTLANTRWTFANTAKVVKVVMPTGAIREYRGSVSLVPRGTGGRTVNRLRMEDYLRSVVPSEMPTSWLPDAVRTQAVAARTYAAQLRSHASVTSGYHVCDTTNCQVYHGLAVTSGGTRRVYETAAGNAAVTATANSVLTYGSSFAFTQFSSSNGGHSSSGGYPYLVAKPDPYDGVVVSQSWTRKISADSVASRWSVGRVLNIQVTARDGAGRWGGRVKTLKITGTTGSVTVTGERFRFALGLRSTLFTLGGATSGTTSPAVPVTLPPGTPYATFPRSYAAGSRADLLLVDSAGRLLRYPVAAGQLQQPVTIGSGFGSYSHVVNAGDWNGDGYQDVIARTADSRLRLFRGTSSGRLGTAVDMGLTANVTALTSVGDVTRDRYPDLVAITAAGNLRLYPGDGRTGLRASVKLAAGWGGRDWLRGTGDFTGDSRPDLLSRLDGRLSVHPGTATGFGAPILVSSGWDVPASITSIGDFDGDGRADVVARTRAGGLVLHRGTGTGRLLAGRALAGTYAGTRFAV